MPQRTYTVPAKPKTDDEHLELLARIIFVIGFNYTVVEQRWPLIRKSFHNFDIDWVANATEEDLFGKPGIINNRRKLATIIENAKTCRAIVKEHGSMQAWVKSSVQAHKKDPIFNKSFAEICQETFKGIGATTKDWVAYVFAEGKKKPERVTADDHRREA